MFRAVQKLCVFVVQLLNIVVQTVFNSLFINTQKFAIEGCALFIRVIYTQLIPSQASFLTPIIGGLYPLYSDPIETKYLNK